jgi:CRP/FNR family transcriptional regulator
VTQASAARLRHHRCKDCDLTVPNSICLLPEDLRASLDTLKTTGTYAKGDVVFHEGGRSHSVFLVCEGSVKLTTASADGKVLLLKFAGPGDILGIADVIRNTPFGCSAVAADETVLGVIPSDTFLRFIRTFPDAGVRLTEVLSAQYKAAQRETRFLAFGGTSLARLAHLLLEWAAERGVSTPEGIRIPSRATQTELAQAIGATRETVTRILGQLIRDGVLSRSADAIVIRDEGSLRMQLSG